MPKILVLKKRFKALVKNRYGHEKLVHTWHDYVPVINLLNTIATGKSLSKQAMWMQIGAKVELAKEKMMGDQIDSETPMADFEIELRNTEARLLWREMSKQPPESFGRDREGKAAMPNPGHLYIFLTDVAEQLGYTVPEPDDEDDD